MQCLRFILPPFVILAVLVLSGALGQPPRAPSSKPPGAKKDLPPPKPDAEGTKTLRDAIVALSAQPWIETTFWQQASMQGLTFQAEGKYRAEPKTRRMNMDLAVHVGNATGKLEVICDGVTVWERLQIGKSARPEIRKTELKKILEALKGVNQEQVQAALVQTQSLAGVVPLLQNVQEQMTVIRHEKASWQGTDVVKFRAVWSEAMTRGLRNMMPPNASWLPFLPRTCVLYLDRKDGAVPYWPYRIEWRGPAESPDTDVLLLEMEFRSPRLTSSLTAQQAKHVFSFDPGLAQATDQTREATDRAKNRANQLAAQKSK
jgi:hypothetical protein